MGTCMRNIMYIAWYKSFWQHHHTFLCSWKISVLHMPQNKLNFKISTLCLNKPRWHYHYIFFDLWWANRSWCCNIEESYMLLTVWQSTSSWRIVLLSVNVHIVYCLCGTVPAWPVINQHCSCVHLLTADSMLIHLV